LNVVVIAFAAGLVLLFRSVFSKELDRMEKQMLAQRADHREQRINREREAERLMNRVMVQEWQTYAQMNQALSSNSTSDEPGGMSDEEEIRRSIGDIDGVGDTTFIDMTAEMRELGLG
jgi:hypothetical protein